MPTTCSAPGCTAPARARGLCPTHYQRQRRTGSVELPDVARAIEPVAVTVRLERLVLGVVDEMARREGVDRAEWIRRAVQERLGLTSPRG